MSTFQLIADAFRALSNAVLVSKMPPEIPVVYAPGSVATGPAGRHLLKLGEHGGASYEWKPDPIDYAPKEAVASLQVGHHFGDSISFLRWLEEWHSPERYDAPKDPRRQAEIYLDAAPCAPATLVALLDPTRPEIGSVKTVFRRHPSWVAWSGFANGAAREMGHEMLSDLLLDHQALLDPPELAVLVARFKGAAKIEYQPTRDKAEHTGILISWKGSATDAAGAPMELPRKFALNLPPYLGAWEPGTEPAIPAVFSLRPVPPKEGGVVPTFRLRWDNAAEYELMAQALINAGVREQIAGVFGPENVIPLYLGKPGVTHRLIPVPGVAP